MGRIQTGVDRLVALVKDKQKISVDDAAKTLGVSKTVVQEWTDFLEEEGIIEIKYSFAKTYLIDKKMTKGETAQKERELEKQRETFIEKVDDNINAVEHESKGFEEFKKEFEGLKKELGNSVDEIHAELGSLHALEHVKTQAVASAKGKKSSLERKEKEASKAVKKEYERYNQLQRSIRQEEKLLATHRQKVAAIRKGESAAKGRITKDLSDATKLTQQLTAENKALAEGARNLKRMEDLLHATRAEMEELEKKQLQPLRREQEAISRKARQLEEKALSKAQADRAHAKKAEGSTLRARKGMEELFKRRKAIAGLLATIEQDKHALMDELEVLKTKAEAYRVGSNAMKIEELKAKLSTMEKGKQTLQGHLAQFLKLMKGK